MWILIAFDIPSEEGKYYRDLRKKLLKRGFSFIQKSLCLRYLETPDRVETFRRFINQLVPPGQIMFLQIPDRIFELGIFLKDGKVEMGPSPPTPWTVI